MRFEFKTSYNQDIRLFRHSGQVFWYGLLILVSLVAPFVLGAFYVGELALLLIFAIAGVGLMMLVGYTGQVSLGHGAFLGIGAYAHAYFLAQGFPFIAAFGMAGIVSAAVGIALAVPALRMTGIYLAIATLAFSIIVEQVFSHWEPVTGGFKGFPVDPPNLFGLELAAEWQFYYLCLFVLMVVIVAAMNILRSPTGRAMMAIRDSEISAQSMGINLARTKVTAFGISAGITGLAGALFGHKLEYLAPDAFGIIISIQFLLMVVVGGLGSLHGAVFGAAVVVVIPQALSIAKDHLPAKIGQMPGLEPGIFGLILVLFIMFEPMGIYGRWRKVRLFFETFPLYRKATFKRQKTYLRTERMR